MPIFQQVGPEETKLKNDNIKIISLNDIAKDNTLKK
jgi:hypothetical protein